MNRLCSMCAIGPEEEKDYICSNYNASLVIRTSIIRHLNYPNTEISQATPTFTKATLVMAIVKSCKMVFSNCQSNAKCRKCIDYRREAGYMQAHGYRQILYRALQK